MEPPDQQGLVYNPAKRTRSANWSPDEVVKLLRLVQEADVGPSRPMEGPAAKVRRGRAWRHLTDRFNVGGVVYRDTDALKKKLKNLRVKVTHCRPRAHSDFSEHMTYPQEGDYTQDNFSDTKPWVAGYDSMEVQDESQHPSFQPTTPGTPGAPFSIGVRTLTLQQDHDPAMTLAQETLTPRRAASRLTTIPLGPSKKTGVSDYRPPKETARDACMSSVETNTNTPYPGCATHGPRIGLYDGSGNVESDGFSSSQTDSYNTDREDMAEEEDEQEEEYVGEEGTVEEGDCSSAIYQSDMKATPLEIVPTKEEPPPPPSRGALEHCKAYSKKTRFRSLREELLEIEIQNAKAEEVKRQKDIELTVARIAESRIHTELLQQQLKTAQKDAEILRELSETRLKESKQNIEESKMRMELLKLKRAVLLKEQRTVDLTEN